MRILYPQGSRTDFFRARATRKRASRQRNDLFEYTRGTHKYSPFSQVILNLAEDIIVIYFMEQLESNYISYCGTANFAARFSQETE